MHRVTLLTLLALLALVAGACATSAPVVEVSPASMAAPAPAQSASQWVALPAAGVAGPGKDISMILETPKVKLATITLRGGTVLGEHAAPMEVTIVTLSGGGDLVLGGGERLRLDPGHMVVLAPNTAHSVEPDGEGELILLIHHIKSGGAPAAAHHP